MSKWSCPFCGVEVPTTNFACYRHWKRLPASLRARVWAAYRARLRRELSAQELREEQEAVRREALEAWGEGGAE